MLGDELVFFRGKEGKTEALTDWCQMLKEQVVCALDTLDERERGVLQLRFGLEEGRSRTLEEVGREFSVTRERIRQIEAKALRKLRHPSRSRTLRDFLEGAPTVHAPYSLRDVERGDFRYTFGCLLDAAAAGAY